MAKVYELVFNGAGGATLTCDGDVEWTSSADDQFQDEMGDVVQPDDAEDVIAWLAEHDYLSDDDDVDVIDELADDTGEWMAPDSTNEDDEEDETP